MEHIKESDWKVFRNIQPVALDRFCQRTLEEVATWCAAETEDRYQQIQDVFAYLKERRRVLWDSLSDVRRSTAILQLVHMYNLGLVSNDELGRLSQETLDEVEAMLSYRSR